MTDPTFAHDSGDLDSLLGAYALDALDADDRARVDAYLERDAAARAEVDEMRETAASLALLPATPVAAPPELWDRIAEVIATDRDRDASGSLDENDENDELAARRARRTRPRWIAPAVAAAAIAVVVLAAQVVSLHGQLDRAHQVGASAMAAAFDHAARADGARKVALQSDSGATLARVVLLPDGTGFLRGDHLAPLAPDQTYQLWAVTGPKEAPVVVSAGVLGPHPTALGFRASGPVRAFAVTVERAGGVVTSKQTPVVEGAVA